MAPPPRRERDPLWVGSLVVGTLLAIGLGFFAGHRGADDPSWPSYADTFGAVAPVVVNVSIDGPEQRVGSGFAVSSTEVVTARHLVVPAGDGSVVVRDIGGWALPAEVVGTDARSDLALLRVLQGGLRPAVLGDSDLSVGTTVIAIGNPYGLGHSLSVGVVGHRGRRLAPDVGDGPRVDFLQLSMPLNPGNSGGPLFDVDGRVVGVLSGTHAQGQAIAFAVPVEALIDALPALRRGARVSRAFLGIGTRLDGGAVVVRTVIPASPADRAGLRPADAIVRVGDAVVDRPDDLQRILDGLAAGREITVEVLRDGVPLSTQVTLADWASQPVVAGGMTLRPAPGAGGEVVAVRPRSRADHAGVQVGDVVRSVDGVPVRAPADIKDGLSGGEPAQLDLVRGGVPLQLRLGEPG